MKNITSQKWVAGFIVCVFIALIACGTTVFVIDPYYHYRLPDNGLIYNSPGTGCERYINNGIIKRFKYNAIITGTSMTENFKTSEFDDIFGVMSIKIPFSGASFKEINDNLETAFSVNPNIKIIIRSLDLDGINKPADSMRYISYPEYLYDESLLNDVNYWLDKYTLLSGCGKVIVATIKKSPKFNFDDYANWNDKFSFGKEAVLDTYERSELSDDIINLSNEEIEQIIDNVETNVVELARRYPDTRFIMFLTPYSICYWDSCYREGILLKSIQTQKIAIEKMLECDNIEIYSFCDDFELVCNLDNYKDRNHYGEDINSYILEQIGQGKHRITKDNYEKYIDEITDFYSNYNYNNIYLE